MLAGRYDKGEREGSERWWERINVLGGGRIGYGMGKEKVNEKKKSRHLKQSGGEGSRRVGKAISSRGKESK